MSDTVVSYGSCQFPTLGFVVERFKQREQFVSEPFWKLVVTRVHDTDGKCVEFVWERVRLFDYDGAWLTMIDGDGACCRSENKAQVKVAISRFGHGGK